MAPSTGELDKTLALHEQTQGFHAANKMNIIQRTYTESCALCQKLASISFVGEVDGNSKRGVTSWVETPQIAHKHEGILSLFSGCPGGSFVPIVVQSNRRA